VALACGCISADRPTVLHNLKQARSVVLVVGGADEALLSGTKKMRLVLEGRKGFVKMGLETGASLVPCLAFGENNAYYQRFDSSVRAVQVGSGRGSGWGRACVCAKGGRRGGGQVSCILTA
jgi:hypothetical protein